MSIWLLSPNLEEERLYQNCLILLTLGTMKNTNFTCIFDNVTQTKTYTTKKNQSFFTCLHLFLLGFTKQKCSEVFAINCFYSFVEKKNFHFVGIRSSGSLNLSKKNTSLNSSPSIKVIFTFHFHAIICNKNQNPLMQRNVKTG